MNKKNFYFMSALAIVLIVAFSYEVYNSFSIQDNKLYIAKNIEPAKDIEKITTSVKTSAVPSFFDIEKSGIEIPVDSIPLTLSPDKKYLFLMLRPASGIRASFPKVVLGPESRYMSLLKLDMATGLSAVISNHIPFITTIKWSPDGNVAAFCGDGKLLLYDNKENKFILENELNNENIRYFEWSADGKKLYTEQPSLPNGIIVYMDSKKKAQPFEIKENNYLKFNIDNLYYYSTVQNISTSNLSDTSTISTVISDKNGSMEKMIADGYFRDAYKTSLLVIDKLGGLNLLQDLNSPKSILHITSEPVYDAKFIHNGNFAYVTRGPDIEKNTYILHISDGKGEKISNFEISGSSFLLGIDGKNAFINGPQEEKIDFIKNSIYSLPALQTLNVEQESILAALRGGIHSLFKYVSASDKDYDILLKYFDPSILSKQLNLINKDISLYFNKNWNISMDLIDYKIYEENSERRAKVKVEIAAVALWSEEFKISLDINLTKVENSWHIYSVNKS